MPAKVIVTWLITHLKHWIDVTLIYYAGCNCNNHASTCHFDAAVFEASGQVSGGVCDDCEHNTVGHKCEQCKAFFYLSPGRDISDIDACQRKYQSNAIKIAIHYSKRSNRIAFFPSMRLRQQRVIGQWNL